MLIKASDLWYEVYFSSGERKHSFNCECFICDMPVCNRTVRKMFGNKTFELTFNSLHDKAFIDVGYISEGKIMLVRSYVEDSWIKNIKTKVYTFYYEWSKIDTEYVEV
jgi:hypothetical protein